MSSKVLVSLSGGMDSATCLTYALNNFIEVQAISFYYGSKHNEFELECANKLAQYYNIKHELLPILSIGEKLASSLLLSGGHIPEGHYEDETMKATVVPGRNLIFNSILAAIAESRKLDFLMVGIHSGDHAIYPDCRPEFFYALKTCVHYSTEGKVSCLAPFLSTDKTGILKYGISKGTPYHITRTCYKAQEEACGKCGSCRERLEAWKSIGKVDPIEYEGA